MPGYASVDVSASYRFDLPRSVITMQLNVHNLLDKEYYDGSAGGFGTEVARNFIYPGAPRTLVGSVRMEF
jgi:iron complex outermembrane receptor protein